MGSNASPEVVDWNEDGLLDLLVASGTGDEAVWLYLNKGTKEQYKFESYEELKAGGKVGENDLILTSIIKLRRTVWRPLLHPPRHWG